MWTTAVTDLRNLLSDNPNDRLRYLQTCFGKVDGSNGTFKTFEFRRVTDFTSDSTVAPLGVYVGGVRVNNTDITDDDVTTGVFTLRAATGVIPIEGQGVEASFYTQWFLDTELDQFLKDAGLWAVSSDLYINLGGGLIPAALDYAAHRAYQKMAMRWRDYIANTYKLEDQPKESGTSLTEEYEKSSQAYFETAEEKRKTFYSRQDRNQQPLFANIVGVVRRP